MQRQTFENSPTEKPQELAPGYAVLRPKMVIFFVHRFGCGSAEAEDLLQEAEVRLLAHGVRADELNPALVSRVARNIFIDQWRQARRRGESKDEPRDEQRSAEEAQFDHSRARERDNPVFKHVQASEARARIPGFFANLATQMSPAEAQTLNALVESARVFDHDRDLVDRFFFVHAFLNKEQECFGCPDHSVVKARLCQALNVPPDVADMRSWRLKRRWAAVRDALFTTERGAHGLPAPAPCDWQQPAR